MVEVINKSKYNFNFEVKNMTEVKEEEKYLMSPEVCSWADDEKNIYKIEIQLPGVEKDSIKLKMHDDSFFIKGETEDTVYIGSYGVCCPIKPEEAKIIETELTSDRDKIEAVRMIETERSPERIVSLVRFMKEMEEREIELVKEIDTGDIWLCPVCKKKYHLTHMKPSGMHRFEEVVE